MKKRTDRQKVRILYIVSGIVLLIGIVALMFDVNRLTFSGMMFLFAYLIGTYLASHYTLPKKKKPVKG